MKSIAAKDRWLVMASAMLSMLVASLDLTIVAPAMPQIIDSLSGFEYYAWPLVAFSLTMAVSVPLSGKFADLYGYKPVYGLGIVIFLCASVFCGLSHNMMQLIVARGLQGIGGAILVSNTMAIVGILFPPAERTKYTGILGSGAILSSIAGPSLGGYITDHWSWRWIFYINAPLCFLTFVLLMLAVLPAADRSAARKRIDCIGIALLMAALVPLLLAITWGGSRYAWDSVLIVAMLGCSAVAGALFVAAERRAADPIVPMTLFRNAVFNSSAVQTFLVNGVLVGVTAFMPLFARNVMAYGPSEAGKVITPMMIAIVAALIGGGIVVSRTKRYKIQAIAGIAALLTGCSLLLSLNAESGGLQLTMRMIVIGIGAGMSIPIFTTAAQNSFDERQIGVVTSNLQLFQTLGQTIAPSVLGTVMNHAVSRGLTASEAGGPASGAEPIRHIFVVCIVISALALIASLFMKEVPLQDRKAAPTGGVEF